MTHNASRQLPSVNMKNVGLKTSCTVTLVALRIVKIALLLHIRGEMSIEGIHG